MGKAFSEKEQTEIKEKLRRTGLRLFAEKGIKGVSVRELTSAAGIAQGGFYTFYKDKNDFIGDLIELRVTEKLSAMEERKSDSQDDPVSFLAEMFYAEGMHLKQNKAFDNSLSGTFELFANINGSVSRRVRELYRGYLETLADHWRSCGFTVEADIDGLLSLIRAAGAFISNASLIDEEYFPRIYRVFCYSEIGAFLRVSR